MEILKLRRSGLRYLKKVDLLGTAKLFHCRDTTFAEDSSRVWDIRRWLGIDTFIV